MLRLSAERGGDPDREGKKDPLDVVVWRGLREGEPSWESPFGPGRPGWHIECAAIATRHLGLAFDVQGGGTDLVFPHHEMSAGHAQVAQPDASFAQAYVHAGMVGYDGEKMSKSKGNLVFVSALRNSDVDPMAIRLALLRHHYRSDWEWTDAELFGRRGHPRPTGVGRCRWARARLPLRWSPRSWPRWPTTSTHPGRRRPSTRGSPTPSATTVSPTRATPRPPSRCCRCSTQRSGLPSDGSLGGMSDNAVRPKLAVSGASDALQWYADVLDAVIGDRYQAGEQVVFAELEVLGTTITLKDADGADPVPQPGPILDCVVDDPDAVATRMVAAGAEVVFPVDDQPYGARGGRVRDPFGVQWLLQTPVTMTPEEIQRAIDQMQRRDRQARCRCPCRGRRRRGA